MPRVRDVQVPWILWPFVALWDLVARLIEITGRLIGVVVGFVLLLVGGILIVTLVGAPVGIPLAALGLLIMLRSIF